MVRMVSGSNLHPLGPGAREWWQAKLRYQDEWNFTGLDVTCDEGELAVIKLML